MRSLSFAIVARDAIDVASLGDLALQIVQTLLQPLQCRRLQARPHDAEAVAEAGALLAVDLVGRHRANYLAQRLYDLVQAAEVA
jgi:hypothetical protein